MKTISILLILSVLALNSASGQLMLASDNKFELEQTTPNKDKDDVNWYVAIGRGFWTGLLEGIYNVQTAVVSDSCLNKKITDKVFRIIDNYNHSEDIVGVIQSILDIAAVVNNFNECGIEQLIFDLDRFCDKADCSTAAALKNIQDKVFALIDKINNIAECYVDFPTQTEEQVKKEGNIIGKNFGQIVRMLLNIKTLGINEVF